MDVLHIVRKQLLESHDIRNTQIRMFQIAKDATLALSPGQRGALNFYSSLPHVDEDTLNHLLRDLSVPATIVPATIVPTAIVPQIRDLPHSTFEPVVKQIKPNQYQWSLNVDGTKQLLIVDSTLYATPTEAQTQADQFLEELNHEEEKSWIRLGIVHWVQQNEKKSSSKCQAELLHIQKNYYIMVTNTLSEPFTKDLQEQKTVHYTSKVLNMEPLVHPTWITRGFIPQTSHGMFYILFKVNLQPHENTLLPLVQQLERILC